MSFDPGQVYQPAEDTFLLIGAALAEVRCSDFVCEIGCGSGAVSVAVMGRCGGLVAVDINPHAVACARERGVDAVLGDMFSPFGEGVLFDLILFNAPYLPTLPEERVDDWLEYALGGGV
ncbi:MAG TPA: methyltransferase domain-containing protein, partial [Methanocorpusculum sp.]|nr:methyltransferase domain-containing protein [Methanocorpusculum sp.]